jgi:hypothetical protein
MSDPITVEMWAAAGAAVAGGLAWVARLAQRGEARDRAAAGRAGAGLTSDPVAGLGSDLAAQGLASAVWRGQMAGDLERLAACVARLEAALMRVEVDARATARGVDVLRDRRGGHD